MSMSNHNWYIYVKFLYILLFIFVLVIQYYMSVFGCGLVIP